MNDTNPLSPQRKAITPLWIVALFVSLTEVVLGAAVTQTLGGIQIALTVFVLAFPILIATAFFLVLWYKSFVFYPPTEFGNQTNVIDYVRAMQGHFDVDKQINQLHDSLRTALLSEKVITEIVAASNLVDKVEANKKVGQILDSASDSAVNVAQDKLTLTIDTRPLLHEKGRIWREVYDPTFSVNAFTDLLYFKMRPEIPPFTYGSRWLIRDKKSDQIFQNLGYSNVASTVGMGDVGIKAGMVLEIISPTTGKK